MSRAHTGAGEHRNGKLWNQRHVKRDAITPDNASLLQNIREFANFSVQLLIGERALVAGFAFPNKSRFVAAPA